jgi:uncharacterized protein (TIGR03083 family)
MEPKTLTTHLAEQYALLRDALASADPSVRVPACPDWTVADLEEHVTAVYLHKVTAMRLGAMPKPWPPAEGVGSLDDAWTALLAELTTRSSEETTPTWFEPDQTVGFWVRRMAQETAIHRVDAEGGAGREITPMAPELAVDGIGEVLGWVVYGSVEWHEEFADALAKADGRPLLLSAGAVGWLITMTPERVVLTETGPEPVEAAVTVAGDADAICRWLWSRDGDVTITGDESLVARLRAVLAPVMR